MSKKTLFIACVLAFVAGRMTADFPPTTKDRPVLAALAKFAKMALWFAAFAEPAPEEQKEYEVRRVLTDEHGYATINHSRGW